MAETKKKVSSKKATVTEELSDEAKMKMRLKLIKETGLSVKRAEVYLDRTGWNMDKVYEMPQVKKALKAEIERKTKESVQAMINTPADDNDEPSVKMGPSEIRGKSKIVRFGGSKGLEFKVTITDNGDMYYGNTRIRSDASGLYAPYLTQKQICDWTRKYVRQTENLTGKMLARRSKEKHPERPKATRI